MNEQPQQDKYPMGKIIEMGLCPILSNDPDALTKLKEKLEYLEFVQNRMKEANRLIRKNDIEGLKKIIPDFEKLLTSDERGYASYRLTNNSAEIRRIKKRIARLEQLGIQQSTETKYKNFTVREDLSLNKYMLVFKQCPDKDIQAYIKSWGFRRINPDSTIWTRTISAVSLVAVKIICEKLVDVL